jgi:hypothetical protein
VQRLTRSSLKLFAFTLLSAVVFGGAVYAQASGGIGPGNFTLSSLKGTYTIGVRNILPNCPSSIPTCAQMVESVAAIGMLVFDGAGNLTNYDTFIYSPDPTTNTIGVFPASNVTATYTVNPDGVGVIQGLEAIDFLTCNPQICAPTRFIITRSECGIAQELFIILGFLGQNGGLVTLPAQRRNQTRNCGSSDFTSD